MALGGDINVTIYGGDRQLWSGGRILLTLLDPFSNAEKILAREYVRKGTKSVHLRGAPADRGQKYSLLSAAKGHRDAAVYPVRPRPGGVVHTAVMLVRNTPDLDLDGFSFELLEQYSPPFHTALAQCVDEQGFRGLEPGLIACALNIEAKLRATALAGEPAVRFLKSIESKEDIHQDRIYAKVDPQMPDKVREEIQEKRTFLDLPEWANELWHEGFPVSFKQRVPFGSLQLSFADRPEQDGSLKADIDVDLYTDVGHLGEVMRNKLTKQKTDPYTVYVQLFDQRIFPLYVLKP